MSQGVSVLPFDISLVSIVKASPELDNQYRLFFAVEGTLAYQLEGQQGQLKKDELLMINPNESFTLTSEEENAILFMTFDRQLIEGTNLYERLPLFVNDLSKLTLIKESQLDIVKKNLLLILLDCIGGESNVFDQLQKFYELLAILVGEFVVGYQEEQTDERLPQVEDPRISETLRYIEGHYQEKLSLEQLANLQYLTPFYFSKLFKDEVGLSLSEYLQARRGAKAKELLALPELTISQIADASGFSNEKAFYKFFRDTYGLTPKQYQKQVNSESIELESDDIRPIETEEIYRLLSYILVNKNIPYRFYNNQGSLNLSVKESLETVLNLPDRLVTIGNVENGEKAIVQKQLVQLQKEQGFEFIHFTELLAEDNFSYSNEMVSNFIRNRNWFDFINEQGLKPMVRLTLPREVKSFHDLEDWFSTYRETLVYLKSREQALHIEMAIAAYDEQFQQYQLVYDWMKEISEDFTVGLKLNLTTQEELLQLEEHLVNYQPIIEFYSVILVGEIDTQKGTQGNDIIEKITYLADFLDGLKLESVPIYLLDWNTLMGYGDVLSGTFYRAALILDTIVALADRLSGIGYWLNIGIDRTDEDKCEISSLSLFMYDGLRRPVYHALTLLYQLSSSMVAKTETSVLTFDKKREAYQLVIWNPTYMNPLYSLDYHSIQKQNHELMVALKGLPKGTYFIKKYTLSKDQGGIYNTWLSLGGVREIDRASQTHLETTILPQLEVQEKKVSSELAFQLEMSFNSCHLLEIKKVN